MPARAQRSLVKPFEPGGGLRRPEHLDAVGFEVVGKAGDERRLGADDDQADRVLEAEAGDRVVIANIERC